MTTDTFSKTSPAATGLYSGDYLWSNSANWSAGLPASASSVVLSLAGATSAVDQAYTVNSVTWGSSGNLVIGGTLNAQFLSGVATGRTATNLSVLAGGTLTTTANIILADQSQASFAGTENTQQFSFSPLSASERNSSFAVTSGTFTAAVGVDLTGVGTASIASGATLTTSGTLKLYSATLDIAGTASIGILESQSGGNATIEGAVIVNSLGGGGQFALNAKGSLEVTNSSFTNSTSTGGDSFSLTGGTLTLDSPVTINAGSSFTFGTTNGGKTNTSLLDLADTTSGSFGLAVNALDLGDKLQFGSAVFRSAAYNSATKTLTLTGTGSSLALTNVTFASDVGVPNFILGSAANGGSIITVNCFLAGTRIATPAGEVAIDRLAAGDLVLAVEGDRQVARAVRWAGWRQVDLRLLDGDAARDAAPIRIRAHAFGDDIPARDLLLTGDHGILVAGLLVPARMLVNGASIVREHECIEYRIHHLELDTHAIVLAEGLTTESYFGPANHPGFNSAEQNQGDPSPAAAKTIADTSAGFGGLAAPRRTDRETVEPVWRRLSGRARALGFAIQEPGCVDATTEDAELCLKLANGVALPPIRRNGLRHFFVMPAHSSVAVLQSRSAIPAEIEGPFVDDRRRLGVCVRSITLWTDLRSTAIRPGASDAAGWHTTDRRDGGCWSNGAGTIIVPDLPTATILEVECVGAMRYSIDGDLSSRLKA